MDPVVIGTSLPNALRRSSVAASVRLEARLQTPAVQWLLKIPLIRGVSRRAEMVADWTAIRAGAFLQTGLVQ